MIVKYVSTQVCVFKKTYVIRNISLLLAENIQKTMYLQFASVNFLQSVVLVAFKRWSLTPYEKKDNVVTYQPKSHS